MLAQSDTLSIIVWSLVLLGLVVVAFALVAWVKKRTQAPDEAPSAGFTLAELRDLHRQGKLSAEEFERAKAALMASLRPKESPKPDPSKER
jgi:uncharacterized membrane protein